MKPEQIELKPTGMRSIPERVVGNHYGAIGVCRIGGVPQIAVEKHDTVRFTPCTEQFYGQFIEEHGVVESVTLNSSGLAIATLS